MRRPAARTDRFLWRRQSSWGLRRREARPRASKLALIPHRWIPVLQPECGQWLESRRMTARPWVRSGQKNRHHGDDEDDGGGAVFHQLAEALIGLLMGRIVVAVSGRVGNFVMLCHRYPQSMFGSGVEIPQSRRQGNGDALLVHPPPYLGASGGQLSRIQRVSPSSFTSPAARERIMAVALSGDTRKSMSLRPRNTISAPKAARLLPSTNGWLRAMPKAYAAASAARSVSP